MRKTKGRSKKKTTKKSNKKTHAEKAVERFEAADAALTEFMEESEEYIDELRRLVEDRNAAAKSAQLAVKSELQKSRSRRLVFGAFGAIKKSREY